MDSNQFCNWRWGLRDTDSNLCPSFALLLRAWHFSSLILPWLLPQCKWPPRAAKESCSVGPNQTTVLSALIITVNIEGLMGLLHPFVRTTVVVLSLHWDNKHVYRSNEGVQVNVAPETSKAQDGTPACPLCLSFLTSLLLH